MNRRINWDELFMLHVRAYAMRSACINYKVGAVFVRDKKVLTGGYNGPPKKEPNCYEVGCAKRGEGGRILPAGSGRCRGAHAEMNAVVNASAERGNLKGSTVYCTFSPCLECAKHLVNLEISEFVYTLEYKELEGKEAIALLKRHEIVVRQFILKESVLRDFMSFSSISDR
jgi:dCMP deaminase